MCMLPEHHAFLSRRHFFGRTACGFGPVALASLLNPQLFAAPSHKTSKTAGVLSATHFPPRAKRVIYLFMHGGPMATSAQPAMIRSACAEIGGAQSAVCSEGQACYLSVPRGRSQPSGTV